MRRPAPRGARRSRGRCPSAATAGRARASRRRPGPRPSPGRATAATPSRRGRPPRSRARRPCPRSEARTSRRDGERTPTRTARSARCRRGSSPTARGRTVCGRSGSRGGRVVAGPPRPEAVVPDVDRGRFDTEVRERGADLAPVVGPVVQRLGQPECDGGVPLVPVLLVDLADDRVRVRVRRQEGGPRPSVVLHRRPKLLEVHALLVDPMGTIARDVEQVPGVRADEVTKRPPYGAVGPGDGGLHLLGAEREAGVDHALSGPHVVGECVLQHRAAHDEAASTGFDSVPTPSTSTSTVSPAFSGPTPSGVPVRSTSPGSSVMNVVTYSISEATLNTMSLVCPACRTSPFSRVSTRTSFGSRSVSIHGPSGHDPSNPFARAHWSSVFWRSRSVTSFAHV